MPKTANRRKLRLGAILLLSGMATACMDRNITTSGIPDDYRQRHSIQLKRANQTLDVFVGRTSQRGFDDRQTADIRGFARDYMENGEGPLIAYLPTGGNGHAVSSGLNSIRGALAGGGAAGRLQIAHYQADPSSPGVIKLAFARLMAKVDSKCGYDEESITPTTLRTTNQNSSPYNFGCTYQRNLAAQIADPRDLVRPRQEGPVDVDRRTSGIERIRRGEAQELKPAGKSLKSLVNE